MEISKGEAVKKLRLAADQIESVRQTSTSAQEFKKWRRDTKVAIGFIFGHDSDHIKEFEDIEYTPMVMAFVIGDEPASYHPEFSSGLDTAEAVLQSMIREIEEYWTDGDSAEPQDSSRSTLIHKNSVQDVFVVHGHDDGLKETVARFLQKIGINPIILHEQPNKGRTIIEKFEDYSSVNFAVVLITPDDIGGSAAHHGDQELKPRARQNVIFEFGYFVGKLGRSNVCGLLKGEIDIPSDYSGVVYVPVDDAGHWQISLLKELKNAGYDVDANLAI